MSWESSSRKAIGDESRERRTRRSWHPTMLTALLALLAQSCGLVSSEANSATPGASGAANAGTGGALNAGTGGTLSLGGSQSAGAAGVNGGGACAVDDTLFADQTVIQIGSQRVFYSWTTDDQVAELRAGGPLFSRSESPGQGPGLAVTQLAAFGASGTGSQQTLAAQLASSVFAKIRYGWTNPWATLLGWPGESYGTQLLQIELKPEAWIAFFSAQGLYVNDAQGQSVAIETALASPERIGAIYFESSADPSSVTCGTFSTSAVAFREFVLGNIQMVQRWSLATPEIAGRLSSDITELQAFESELSCLAVPDQASWSSGLECAWQNRSAGSGALMSYDFSLGIPSALYWPSMENIAALIAALQASMPTGDPLSVTPGG
ncbi:MAG TPA: hypothetical protein VGM29_07980 [Polyangiaceae bacterium]